MTRPASLLLALCLPAALLFAGEEEKAAALGAKVPRGSVLRDVRGNRRILHDFKGHRALVLAFVGCECPLSNLYLPDLLAWEKEQRANKVQVLAVYPGGREDLDQIAAHASDRDLPFPVLKDVGGKLASQLGVTRVPTVVVLDAEHQVRYRGRINDRYGVASKRAKATREDLAAAVEEVLADKKVRVPETEVDGCLIGGERKGEPRKDLTFSKDVAPVLQKACQACHRPEQAAPFSLLTYDDAVKHARMIKEVTAQRRMPPWHADPRFGKFSNDRRLSTKEIEILSDWVEAGMPRGEDKDLPKPVEWPKGWALGKPDLVLEMPEEFEVPASGTLPYKNFILEPNFKEDRWVRMAECRPGAPGVVHHVVIYIQAGGSRSPLSADGGLSVLVGWAPGDLGLVCPPDTALKLPKGCKLRMEMHYTPNGTKTKDRSSLGITFADKPPKFEMFMNEFANMGLVVPPHEPHHKAEATIRFRADARLLSVVPHMHWRGKDYRYEVVYPDGKRQTVVSVPRWDFNWQNVYRFEEPVRLPKGSKLYSVAHWDNSRNNPLNPAPEKKVSFGLQTWDEMMVGWVCYVWERPETAAELAKTPLSAADQMFDRFDSNGDDVITANEIPERFAGMLRLIGTPVPEKMTRKEFGETFGPLLQRATKPREKKP